MVKAVFKLWLRLLDLQKQNNYVQNEYHKLIEQRHLVLRLIQGYDQQLNELKHKIHHQNKLLEHIEPPNLVCNEVGFNVLSEVVSPISAQVERDGMLKKIYQVLNYEVNLDQVSKKSKVLQSLPQFKTHTRLTPKIKIAVIMDEFSYAVFSNEAELLQLSLNDYIVELEQFKPDLLLIESAWFGYKKQWKWEMSIVGSAVFALIRHCSLNRIMTAFWNKEDPTHFEHFLPLARMVDFVFTTEQNCIPIYQYLLGHKRVHLLQFAVQPVLHNPVEKYTRQDKFCFAGAYYYQHPERQDDFDRLINVLKTYKAVKIYDRNFRSLSQYNRPFPERYKSMISGKLEFNEIDRAYKGYKYAINLNTVKDAQTMFSRRAFELMASNTLMISNHSAGLKNTFGALVFSSDNSAQLAHYLQIVCNEPLIYAKLRLLALREVMSKHTYFERMAIIKAVISGNNYINTLTPIVVLAKVTKLSDALMVIKNFNAQSYLNKRLYLVKSFKLRLKNSNPLIKIFGDQDACLADLFDGVVDNQLLGFFSAEDYYGPNYLFDLALAPIYSTAHAFGKASYYVATAKFCKIAYDKKQYKVVHGLKLRRCLVRQEHVRTHTLQHWLNEPEIAMVSWGNMLGLDEFNYCQCGMKYYTDEIKQLVDDLDSVALVEING